MRTRAAATLTALMLALTACGGGDDEVAAMAIADAMLDGQDEGTVGDVLSLERAEADCIGEGLVGAIGTTQLQDYGFLTDDLESTTNLTDLAMSAEHSVATTETLFGCTDVVTKLARGIAEAQSAARIVDDETLDCLKAALSEDVIRRALTLAFSGRNDQAGQVLINPLMRCAPPEVNRRLPDRPR